ncbi:MAG: PAS domain S-box protein [Oscillospiraceae bacterium]|nr:PAS domain S-box protein [Oscillospiraceae bacterium]
MVPQKSISFKIAVLLAVLLMINGLAAGIFSYAFFRNGSVQAYGNTALTVAQSAGAEKYGAELLEILQKGEKTEVWTALKARLDELSETTEASAVYILGLPENNEYPFIILGHGDIAVGTMKSADSFAPVLDKVLREGKAFSSGIYKDNDEYIISGYVPVYTGGQIVAVAGADISAESVFSDAFSFAFRNTLLAVALFIFLSALAYIFSRQFFSRRISLITETAERIANGNCDTFIDETQIKNDEIGRAAQSLNKITSVMNLIQTRLPGYNNGDVQYLSSDSNDSLTGVFQTVNEVIFKSVSVINNLDSQVYISDAQTYEILYANRKLLEAAELSEEQIQNKRCWEILHKEMKGPCPFCPLQKLLAQNDKTEVYEREHFDRFTKKWYLLQGSIIKWTDGRPAHFEIATDITKLKTYEAGIKNLSAIIAVPDAGIVVKDRRGVMTEWNRGAQNILGYSKEEVIGKTSKDFTPYAGHAEIERIALGLRNGRHIAHIEEVRIHKDGREINCSISYSPITGDDDEFNGSVSIFHDISEKIKIEKTHKQLESTLVNLFDNLSHGFVLFELSGEGKQEHLKLVMANKAFRKFSDLKEDEDLTGLPFSEVFSAATEHLPYYITIAKIGGGRTNEAYNYALGLHINEVTFSPAHGQVALLLTDRTSFVMAQEALQKREDDLAMLFSSMTSGFCMGKITRNEADEPEDVIFEIVNAAYETLEDFAPGTLLGRKLYEVSPKEWKRHFKIYVEVATKRKKISFTKYIPSKGKTLDVVCYSPDKDYFACIESDVSERVSKDEELKKAYRDTEAILSEIPAPICVVGRESGVILGCNRAFVSICGAKHEYELKDEQIGYFLTNNKSDKDLKQLLGSSKFKSFLNKLDDTFIEVEVFSRPFVYKEQIAYALCCIDMTQQKIQEEILRETALTAEETSRLKSMFLANMSHEIRTPMNGIIGLAELALSSPGMSEKATDYLSKIKTSATGLLGIINDILDISKIEAGKIELEKVTFTFGDILKSCETVTEFSKKSKNVDVNFKCNAIADERVTGDPTKLRQIIMNLLSNALKFTDEGVVELLADITKKDEDYITVRFTVKDTGIGMSAAQIKKIFEPFIQADTSTTRKYGGTGLGLSITNSLLDLMQGKLTVESNPGEGSTFSFTLTFPLAEKTSVITDFGFTADMNKRPVFSAEALVCEDNAINCQVIEEHLLRIGINPIIAENGKIGVNMVKTRIRTGNPFDIILMDIHMPVMDGLEAMRKLTEAGCTTPVIAMTANAMREDKELVLQSGMSDYICKPFSANDLWSCLLKYLKPIRMEEITPDKPSLSSGEIIDEKAGLEKSAGDPKLYKKIKVDFYFENKDIIKKINDAAALGDYKSAHRLAHTLKGVATLIGANLLSEATYELEASYKEEKQNETVLSLVKERLDEVLEILLPQANQEKEAAEAKFTASEDVQKTFDYEKAYELIKKLEPLLADGNSEAIDYTDEIKEIFAPIPGMSGELISHMLDYEFDDALESLREIKQRVGI